MSAHPYGRLFAPRSATRLLWTCVEVGMTGTQLFLRDIQIPYCLKSGTQNILRCAWPLRRKWRLVCALVAQIFFRTTD
jgi:hypothetical protein